VSGEGARAAGFTSDTFAFDGGAAGAGAFGVSFGTSTFGASTFTAGFPAGDDGILSVPGRFTSVTLYATGT
jgi:hypothetical protein